MSERLSDLMRSLADEGPLDGLTSVHVGRFEASLAAAAGVSWAVSAASGTLALELALEAGGVERGDEVLVPALGAFGTLAAVVRRGALPVVVDVSPGALTLAPDQVAASRTERTRAVMPVHAMGWAPDVAGLRAAAPGILIVEDMSQGFPGRVQGDVAALSLSAGKPVDLGEGGAVLTSDEALARTTRQLACLGHGGVQAAGGAVDFSAGHTRVGTSARMPGLQAALGVQRMEDLDDRLSRWWRAYEAITEVAAALGLRPLPRPRVPMAACFVSEDPIRGLERCPLHRPPSVYPAHREPALTGRVQVHPTPEADALMERLVVLATDTDEDTLEAGLGFLRGL